MRRVFTRHSYPQRGPEVRTTGLSEVLFVLPRLAVHTKNTQQPPVRSKVFIITRGGRGALSDGALS